MKLAQIFPDARVRLLTETVIALVAAIRAIEHDGTMWVGVRIVVKRVGW